MTRGTIQLGNVLVHVMFSGPHQTEDGPPRFIGTATIEPYSGIIPMSAVFVERVRAPSLREAWAALSAEILKHLDEVKL